ncbi:MAG: hypothetical protein LBC97_04300 [Bifidobacteriaceae bacterium]|jgi:hypothetical protein|nr:hypothetical protein [Bifidobacteriaceae bacterium]
MPKTVQIRDIADAVYAGLRRRAAANGVTIPELLRAEAARIASRPTMAEWHEQVRRRTRRPYEGNAVEALDDIRGPWPDAGR